MRGRNPYDEHILITDLLELLLAEGFCKPEFVPMATVREWFPTRERHLADEIVDELAADPDAPLEYVTDIERTIWLVDAEATREYLTHRHCSDKPTWEASRPASPLVSWRTERARRGRVHLVVSATPIRDGRCGEERICR